MAVFEGKSDLPPSSGRGTGTKRKRADLAGDLAHFYRTSQLYQHGLEQLPRLAFERYVGFVCRSVPRSARILDLGCGNGTSSHMLAEQGYAVVAIDISLKFLQGAGRLADWRTQFLCGDASRLPFASETFDAVCCHNFLEHIATPEIVLAEMVRVIKPDGRVIVVSPNLLSPINSLRFAHYCLLRRYGGTWFIRRPENLRFPLGNTLIGLFGTAALNCVRLLHKLLKKDVRFSFRVPDLREPAHADSDSVFLINPVDVRKWMTRAGLRILPVRPDGLGRFLGPLTGGTWVAAQKVAQLA